MLTCNKNGFHQEKDQILVAGCLLKNKEELLLVLKKSEVPLHTNCSESDIRGYVKKKKVSGGTRSDEGRRCRDTFASLKKRAGNLKFHFGNILVIV